MKESSNLIAAAISVEDSACLGMSVVFISVNLYNI